MRRIVVLTLAILCAASAGASADDRSYIGAQALIVTGVHKDVAGAQYGIGAGAFAEALLVYKQWQLHIEGIPVVSIPQRASVAYGQATPAIGIVDTAFRTTLDRRMHLFAGIGAVVINQHTPLPNISQVVSSRLAGVRYEVRYRAVARNGRIVEALIAAAPRLFGSDHFVYSNGLLPVNKPEVAAEEDIGLSLGIPQRRGEMLFGIRSINFAAKFVNTGEAGDRNNGFGASFELRRFIGR